MRKSVSLWENYNTSHYECIQI